MTSESIRQEPISPKVDDYWTRSCQPLASLVFVLPLLAAYEAGVLMLGPQAVRNGADVWLRQLLESVGFGQYFLLPVLTISILVAWHHTIRQPWRVGGGVLLGMVAESILLAFCLRIILEMQGSLLQAITGPVGRWPPTASVGPEIANRFRETIGFLGAGVYEELLFRLILLSVLAWFARQLGASSRPAMVTAVLLSSLAFAAAHYVGAYGEPVDLANFSFWFSFLFRFLAGTFFGMLFVFRGFGIAAGSHAGYDILVGIL